MMLLLIAQTQPLKPFYFVVGDYFFFYGPHQRKITVNVIIISPLIKVT